MTYKTGTIGEFMAWTKMVVHDPSLADTAPKRWFDSEATAEVALKRDAVSAEAMVKLLSPENLRLIRTISDKQPESVHALAMIMARKQGSVSRTLKKLVEAGIIEMEKGSDRRLRPRLIARRVNLEIDFTATPGEGMFMTAEKIKALA